MAVIEFIHTTTP